MQYQKSQMISALHGKRDQYIFHVGVFAAVCVGVDLLVSYSSQFVDTHLLNTMLFLALLVSAFYAGSMTGRHQKTDARNVERFPVKVAQARTMRHEGEYKTRQAAKWSAHASGTTPMRIEVREALFAAIDDMDTAPPEVDREASPEAPTTEPQPETLQKRLKAPRYVSRSSAGAQVPTEIEDTTNEPIVANMSGPSEIDAHVIDKSSLEGVEPSASAYATLMIECVESNDADMALKLFDQILGAQKDYGCKWTHSSTMQPDACSRFFAFVVGQLDDERLRKDGLHILAAVRNHGVQPPFILQDRLICAWGSRLPEQLLYHFKNIQEEGLTLSSAARRCTMTNMVGSTEGGTTSAYSGGWPLRGYHDSGEHNMISPVNATISQDDPTCNADDETPAVDGPDALQTVTAHTALRAGASAFVPNHLGPVSLSMLRSLAPHQDQLPNTVMHQVVPLDAAQRGPPPGLHDEFPKMPMQQRGRQSDECTTVIMRNLPCSFLRDDLIAQLDASGFAGLYNLVYMPIDFKTEMGMGYAFVNLISADVLQRFSLAFEGFRKWPRNATGRKSYKVCTVQLSNTQGLDANLHRYRNSPGMSDGVPEHFRPALFNGTSRIPFPNPMANPFGSS